MCICVNESTMNSTFIYAGEAMMDEKYVHVLAYQNKAESNKPNAMIIPFPTSKEMGPDNVLDCSKYPTFLADIADASRVKSFSKSLGYDCVTNGVAGFAQVFDVGSYTVILASKVSQIPEALERVAENKRPTISTRFLIALGQMYHDQPVAVCCWAGSIEAEPLLWWYEPTNKDYLFIPAMDAHDGNPPDLSAEVDTDHIISVGSTLSQTKTSNKVFYKPIYQARLSETIKNLLPKYVDGTKLNTPMMNGDLWVRTSDLKGVAYPNLSRGSLEKFSFNDSMIGWV